MRAARRLSTSTTRQSGSGRASADTGSCTTSSRRTIGRCSPRTATSEGWFTIVLAGLHIVGIRQFTTFYMRWRVRALSYLMLLEDPYPPFGDAATRKLGCERLHRMPVTATDATLRPPNSSVA